MQSILSALALLLTCSAFSQNLQFSEVLLVTTEQTVPDGKVWKITNVLPSTRLTSAVAYTTSTTGSGTNNGSTQQIIQVNSVDVYVASSNSVGRQNYYNGTGAATQSSSAASSMSMSPIWLPSGSTLAAGSGVYAVSVIEFTQVP